MSDYDNDLIRAAQRDGILDAAGGHRREAVWEREGRTIECLPCGDQGCDYCNPKQCWGCGETFTGYPAYEAHVCATDDDRTAPPVSTLHRTWRDEVGVWKAYEAARQLPR